ncbi:HNH endonuclease [Limnothrix sp. FACHB-708]|uniref:HNH endonuclease n=1 Tax=unclassified Limnothrix TaxID=2632864 RepID=UPI00168806AC|nr:MULTISPECIES: HNH endonuclease [unclassified Limnothrix]MBD2555269.1 HNH endonuclease [Limnothrix sp. FACHB-708]MBD2591622.1 HNH endonuclease [Limnothrix sp. FACHB-406]
MNLRKSWTRDELIIAMNLYCKLSFGQFHHKTPIIIEVAAKLGRTPSSLAMKLSNFASLDPVHQARGIRGLSGASKADQEIWEEFAANWEQLGTESEERFQELVGFEPSILNQALIKQKSKTSKPPSTKYPPDRGIEATEAQVITKIRIGQNFFRQMVLSSYSNRCCITGNPISELLIASHIIPWREQSEHRLNPHNGLCLARTHDAAFDQGLITFDENYNLVLSRCLQEFLPEETLEINFVSYAGSQLRLPEKFHPEPDFLRFHREEVFLGA